MKLGLNMYAVRPSGLSNWVLASVIIGIILIQRCLLWMLFGHTILKVLNANQDWLTWQFLPIHAYTDHFWATFKYLQQTPPLPHLIIGILANLYLRPQALDQSLMFLQFFITAVTSALLFVVLAKLACPRIVAAGIALFFGLSTDLFLLELNSFGQLFYESSAMLFGTAMAVSLCGKVEEASPAATRRNLILAGLCAGLGILTRASFSYLAIPVALAVERRWRWRGALLFLIPIILMQGSWCLKNALVYRHFTLSTSSWSGINAANGFNFAAGYGSSDGYDSEPFVASILSSPERYPSWLIKVLKDHGYADWDTSSASDEMDQNIRAREAAIQLAMGGTDPFSNSITVRLLSDQYARAALHYVLESPWHQIDKMSIGYRLFWQPIADYSGMFMGPIYVPSTHRTLSGGPYFFRSGEAFAKLQSSNDSGPVKVQLPMFSLFFIDTISCFSISLLLPLLMLGDIILRCKRRQALMDGRLWTLIVIVGYGIAVSTMIDLGENMRFRLAFEPILIAVTWGMLMTSLQTARRFRVRLLGWARWQTSYLRVPNGADQTATSNGPQSRTSRHEPTTTP